MLLGPALDPLRSSAILKNIHTLHIRMRQHSSNALYLAEKFTAACFPTIYPGLPGTKGYDVLNRIMNPGYGYGGMIAIDLGTAKRAAEVMELMEMADVGYLAVSLGYFKTLFSNSGKSTSSEVPEDTQKEMGLSEGLVRFSVGLDNDIARTWERIEGCLKKAR
jgi:methionine-gamma-lyase